MFSRLIFLFFVFILTLLLSCETDRVTLIKEEIGCEDWKSSVDLEEQADIIEEYLETQGIRVFYVRVLPAPEDINYCYACFCVTGRLITIRIDEDDQFTAEELGFSLPE